MISNSYPVNSRQERLFNPPNMVVPVWTFIIIWYQTPTSTALTTSKDITSTTGSLHSKKVIFHLSLRVSGERQFIKSHFVRRTWANQYVANNGGAIHPLVLFLLASWWAKKERLRRLHYLVCWVGQTTWWKTQVHSPPSFSSSPLTRHSA